MDLSKIEYIHERSKRFCNISAHYKGIRVAYFWHEINKDGSVLAADIHVCDRVELKNSFPHRLMRRVVPNWQVISARNLGLGGALLTKLLEDCDKRGVPLVYGNVTDTDTPHRPFLKAWYERNGFEIAPPDSVVGDAPNPRNTEYQIIRKLPA